MRKLLLFALLSPLPCLAQPCSVYFKVLQSDPHIPGGAMERASEPQKKWLAKTAPKKYPSACYDSEKATYAIVWTQERGSRLVSTKNEAPITDMNGNRVGTTSTTGTEEVAAFTTYVSVMKIGADKQLQTPPLFFGNDDTSSTNPAKNLRDRFIFAPRKSSSTVALERAVQFLVSLNK